jgi:hypothetical protein
MSSLPTAEHDTRMNSTHAWSFFRAGGFNQVALNSGADLLHLDQLDQKLWVALACPTSGLEFDKATLALIDTDKDGRVRAPELIAAVKWAGGLLKNPDDLLKGSPTLRPAAINEATPEGKSIANFARQVLAKADTAEITIDEAVNAAQTFAAKPFNGDGIIPADSAGDEATKAVILDVISCAGADTDASGKPGLSQNRVDQFFADAAAYSEWWKKAEGDAAVLPLGLNTETAAAAIRAVRPKVDDFFARCRLAAFDPRSVNALNRDEKDFLALAAKDLTSNHSEIASFPLAQVAAGKPLPLTQGVNPAWTNAMATFQAAAVQPLLGEKSSLTEADWAALLAKIAPFEAWCGTKTGASTEKLGLKRVREILATPAKDKLTALIAKDKAEEGNAQAVVGLNRLVHYHRDLYKLCNNFVNFRDFYGRKDKAIFQAGTLYLDQRSCDLCLTVEDGGRHAAMAGLAGTYLAYCDCYRKGTGEKMQIVAAFTGGDSDNLMVGRNGIFYDRQGRDWDATITKITDNPISIRQAFWAPYKKLVRSIEERAAKQAAAAEAASSAKLEAAAAATTEPGKIKPEAPKKIDVGIVAAMAVAFGAIGTAVGYLLGFFQKLPQWQIPLVLILIMLMISAPSMAIAWLKLRKRNLGPILDANGWAVNARAKMNVPFGGALTGVATLPPGAQFGASDQYAQKPAVWPKVFLVLFLAWWVYAFLSDQGWIYKWTDGRHGLLPPEMRQRIEDQKQKAAEEKAAAEAKAAAAAKAAEPAK